MGVMTKTTLRKWYSYLPKKSCFGFMGTRPHGQHRTSLRAGPPDPCFARALGSGAVLVQRGLGCHDSRDAVKLRELTYQTTERINCFVSRYGIYLPYQAQLLF